MKRKEVKPGVRALYNAPKTEKIKIQLKKKTVVMSSPKKDADGNVVCTCSGIPYPVEIKDLEIRY